MTLTRSILVLLVLAAAAAAQDHEPNHRVTNATSISQAGLFGENAIALGDRDGDGYGDYAVAASSLATPGGVTGRIYVYSGLTAELLETYDGPDAVNTFFGQAMADAGDVNGDGFRDLVVTARTYSTPTVAAAGRVIMFSGATGGVLWTYDGPGGGNFGSSVAVVTDGTLTGASLIVVGHPGFTGLFTATGRVVYLDPASGTYLDDEEGLFAFDSLGAELFTEPGISLYSSSGDGRVFLLDGPGGGDTATLFLTNLPGGNLPPSLAWVESPTPGLVVGRPLADAGGFFDNGTVTFHPFGSPTPAATIAGTFTAENVGREVIAGDFDGDGDDEIGFTSGAGFSVTRFRIAEIGGAVIEDVLTGSASASAYAVLGDVTGDGREEWIQSLNGGLATWYECQVHAMGMEETIDVDAVNTRFEYAIDAAPVNAGAIQFTFFGVSGTAPGTMFETDKPLFPLNLDTFTQDALMLLGTPYFPDALSFLDAFGTTTVNVVVPNALAAPASGVEFFACSVVLDFPSLIISAVTNPIRSVFP